MNIKEIIDAERWEAGDHGLAPMPSVEHNASLDRIQAAVDKLIYSAVVTIELQDQRIAELEAQVPKVVKPHIEIVDCGTDTLDLDFCDCGSEVAWHEDYCPDCGAKLDWRES